MHEDVKPQAEQTLIPFYNRFERVFVRGREHFLTDDQGKTVLDFTSGISVVNLGHANEAVNNALKAQIDLISHISNLFYIPQQAELSELISEKSFAGKTFYCNSGGEANEAALKMARIVGNRCADGKNKVLALSGSFHGRTIATITMTGQEKYKKGFEPLMPQVGIVEYNDVSDLEKKFDETVCAVFIEAVQAEGGIRPLSESFVETLKQLAKTHNALIVVDEVQTGIGRTGKYFGYQWYDLEPDMITLAKGLGNGFPVGAVHVRPEIADMMPSGMHASTFGGNYVAMSAGVAVMKQLTPELLDQVNTMSTYIIEGLEALKREKPGVVGEIRGRGLLIGADIVGKPVGEIIQALLDRDIATLRAGDNTLRLAPPFTITETAVDLLLKELKDIL